MRRYSPVRQLATRNVFAAALTRYFETADDADAAGQGVTLIHFSAQPEPYLTRNTPFTPLNIPRHLLNTRIITPKQSLNTPPIPQKALMLS